MSINGNELLQVFEALANPHRLRIVAALREQRKYVSELAREVRMSRPLLYLHLQRLEAAGLVTGNLELSDSGKAMKFYELADFEFHVTSETVAEATKTLQEPPSSKTNEEEE
ncbi:transcriptional regulator [Cohnella sp. CIP 111063]|uniref:ArsR/SmtB family transcription factor n=1 Tax=unclassified Cohnella TaxID=2636738 RepID=UPI000B8BFCB9|nr:MULTISPECIES: metalloregulator ArsR/SmtB family transcription factor [unclassified Cohnella]OXS54278.1 transcriptional regulator [Cohnella sp. CIP 111063]PRX63471.1 ArsR family transcriptional regulator [Cohnella sp. SGD-V74]